MTCYGRRISQSQQDTTYAFDSFKLRGAVSGVICLEHGPGVVSELDPEKLSTEQHLVPWSVRGPGIEYVPQIGCGQETVLPVNCAVQGEDGAFVIGHGHTGRPRRWLSDASAKLREPESRVRGCSRRPHVTVLLSRRHT